MKIIDAKGKACPIPVVLAKKEIDAGKQVISIEVDNSIAVENVSKLASKEAYDINIKEENGAFQLTLSKNGKQAAAPSAETDPACPTSSVQTAIFVGTDSIGSGERELGTVLMKMFFYTLSESADLPTEILLMNSGVKLATDAAVVEHFQVLQNKGVEILICGTCLDFYQLTEQVQIGTVSNMFEILNRMQKANKVISL